jgi:UDP-N-acetylmuramyl pentapeptide phosphotransferase/UDP-N-acetylglucosamine-1-phosphate transferase
VKSPPSENEQYATASTRITGGVVLVMGLVGLIDILVEWRTRSGLIVAALILVLMVLAYVGLIRPSITLTPAKLLIRNHFRDHDVDWNQVEDVDVTDIVRVHTRGRQLRCPGVQLVIRDLRKQRAGRKLDPDSSISRAQFVVQRIEHHVERYGAGSEGGVVSRWAVPELAIIGVLLLIAGTAWLAG